ncbi:MAG TPA: hypothetical protein VGW34_13405 [Allosphingosinicella sp.]|nr:hypothetical protein [Allosphingosinicella sp.]
MNRLADIGLYGGAAGTILLGLFYRKAAQDQLDASDLYIGWPLAFSAVVMLACRTTVLIALLTTDRGSD